MYVDSHKGTDLIGLILKVAGYTYGPLLGLFFFGILSKRMLKESFVPIICIIVPVFCYLLDFYSQSFTGGVLISGKYTGGYVFGNELIILNGALTFIGLFLISKNDKLIDIQTLKA
jgi:hypothetical protein